MTPACGRSVATGEQGRSRKRGGGRADAQLPNQPYRQAKAMIAPKDVMCGHMTSWERPFS